MSDQKIKFGEVCKHGSLRRKCEICELEDQVDKWKQKWHTDCTALGIVTAENVELKFNLVKYRNALESIVAYTPHETNDDIFCARCKAELALRSSEVK